MHHFVKIGFFWSILSCQWLSALEENQANPSSTIDLYAVFMGSPLIYLALLLLSIVSLSIWIYSICTMRLSEMMPSRFLETVRSQLEKKHYDEALNSCQKEHHFVAKILGSGINSRKYGVEMMMSAMQAEGRRLGNRLWQRISLLNEIAVIAPMIGLLGTVVGLFFAFYDTNRTTESLDSVFDGLGIAIGTTVAGLVVAILAMIFYTLLKFKVIHLLNTIECESYAVMTVVDGNVHSNESHPR